MQSHYSVLIFICVFIYFVYVVFQFYPLSITAEAVLCGGRRLESGIEANIEDDAT